MTELINRFTGHSAPVYALCAGDDPLEFYSAGGDGKIMKGKVGISPSFTQFSQLSKTVYCLLKLPDCLIAGQSDGKIIQLTGQGELDQMISTGDAPVFAMIVFRESLLILTGDGKLKQINIRTLQEENSIRISDRKLRCIAIHPALNTIVTGSSEGKITVVDPEKFKVIESIQAHQENFSVNALCFSPSGKNLLSGSRDAYLNIYSFPELKLNQSIPAHNYAIYDIAFSPDEQVFVTASRDKTIKIWNAGDISIRERLDKFTGSGHSFSVNKVLWLTGNILLSTGDDKMIQARRIN